MGDNIGMPQENGDPRAVLIVEDSENSAATLEIAFLGIPGLSVLLASSASRRCASSTGQGSPSAPSSPI